MPLRIATAAAALAGVLPYVAARCQLPHGRPFDVIDPQNWVNPDDMTWDDFKAPPNTSWSDAAVRGSERNFNIALVALDYDDKPFTITQPAGSTVFGNPQPEAAGIAREDVPAFYRDLLNTPNELNNGHTLHEYWMEDSGGKFGVDLTVFGAYRMPAKSWEYGIDDRFNPRACPVEGGCNLNIRTDGLGMWREDVGDEVADQYELVFILGAGQDESSSWQEFGPMKFQAKEDIPDDFGPPRDVAGGNSSLPNWAATRYVEWTSWAAAATLWPNAGDDSSTQCESSGMAVYAHELSHLLNIYDNYNNPYSDPPQRSYTGPWSMLSRGSFNGPGGPHTRWQIPAVKGSSMGSLHTMRDKLQLGLIDESVMLRVSSAALADSGPVVARLTARAVQAKLMGIRVEMGEDRTPECDPQTSAFCDGGGYDYYDVEVIDRMGADSFQPDSGVMVSKSKEVDNAPFQWTIDANPQDIELVDFYRPDGTPEMITIGDYRQLSDALFHAGTRSGSQYEHIDEANNLHFYILNKYRDELGVLSYRVAVRSVSGTSPSQHGVSLGQGTPTASKDVSVVTTGVWCGFALTNNGTYVVGSEGHPQDLQEYLGSDIYRLNATVAGAGWRVEVPNAFAVAGFGDTVHVYVAVGADEDAAESGLVTLTAVSEGDPDMRTESTCTVNKS